MRRAALSGSWAVHAPAAEKALLAELQYLHASIRVLRGKLEQAILTSTGIQQRSKARKHPAFAKLNTSMRSLEIAAAGADSNGFAEDPTTLMFGERLIKD